MLYEVITALVELQLQPQPAGALVVLLGGQVVRLQQDGLLEHVRGLEGQLRSQSDLFGAGEAGRPRQQRVPRITSYNVCYTKLLRLQGRTKS